MLVSIFNFDFNFYFNLGKKIKIIKYHPHVRGHIDLGDPVFNYG